jgi:hypothetical protein
MHLANASSGPTSVKKRARIAGKECSVIKCSQMVLAPSCNGGSIVIRPLSGPELATARLRMRGIRDPLWTNKLADPLRVHSSIRRL